MDSVYSRQSGPPPKSKRCLKGWHCVLLIILFGFILGTAGTFLPGYAKIVAYLINFAIFVGLVGYWLYGKYGVKNCKYWGSKIDEYTKRQVELRGMS